MRPHLSAAAILLALALCAAGLIAPRASGIILLATGDPTVHTATPGDNSGWQYEGTFGGFLGTPVAPYYFLSAAHIGNQGDFVFHGEMFKLVESIPDPAGSDLMIWKVDHPFTDYAPMFTADHGDETGRTLRVIGRGTQRGAEIKLNDKLRGWQWGGLRRGATLGQQRGDRSARRLRRRRGLRPRHLR